MVRFLDTDFMKNLNTILIPATHLGQMGVLEADGIWQDYSDTLAIICHPNPKAGGDMNNKVITTLYRFCRGRGVSAVRFNYRGVGRSSGEIEYGDGEFLDTLNVLDWAINTAKDKQVEIKKLWLFGFSFGGFVACRVADFLAKNAHHQIALDKLILIAPSVQKNDPTGLSLNPNVTHIIYGDDDEWVSPDVMAKFADDFGLNKTVMSNAGHFFHGKLGDLTDVIDKIITPKI